jgi:hypothetical protein
MKALNQWARYFGYNDFDTFIRAGGTLDEARCDIERRSRILEDALNAIANIQVGVKPPTDASVEAKPITSSDAADAEDEPTDSDNAHVQGAELG